MCLYVKSVPTSNHPAIITCKKQLYHYHNGWITGTRGVCVDENGWLFPDRSLWIDVEYDSIIEGGFIHAYEFDASFVHELSGDMCKAYAFSVVAYEDLEFELVCRAMYIPKADETNNKQKTVARINKLKDRTELTKDEMDYLNPDLHRYLIKPDVAQV